jgi:hypothetical protein
LSKLGDCLTFPIIPEVKEILFFNKRLDLTSIKVIVQLILVHRERIDLMVNQSAIGPLLHKSVKPLAQWAAQTSTLRGELLDKSEGFPPPFTFFECEHKPLLIGNTWASTLAVPTANWVR